MEMYIGKILPDGQIQHINVDYNVYSYTTGICLKNFYKTEKRVDDLLALGNLYKLGPTPYGKYPNDDDKVHCDAYIRDNNNKPKGNRAETCPSKDSFFALGHYVFLYQDGCWFTKDADGIVNMSSPAYLYCTARKEKNGIDELTVKTLDKDGLHNVTIQDDIKSWSELEAKAKQEEKCFYVFRKNRLVAALNQTNYHIN